MSFGLVRGTTDYLFCTSNWYSIEHSQRREIENEINTYHADKLLNTSNDILFEYFASKYSFNVPRLECDKIVVDQQEVKIDASQDPSRLILDRSRPFHITGTKIEVEIPFSGDGGFFKIQPTSFSLNPPSGKISANSLILSIQGTNLTPEQVKHQIDCTISDIEKYLSNLRNLADAFNLSIKSLVYDLLTVRKEKLLKDRNLVASLGFPMKQRDSVSSTYASPHVRKKIQPSQPLASSAPYKPEPVLENSQYENILQIISSMVGVMEKSPRTFATIDEEAIRTHFLVQLNAQYEGQATGETFNFEGKTDILIKDHGRNIFIAECKFWHGEKGFSDTIDQLLGYLSWRDTKAAILIFNRNKDFSAVLTKIQGATKNHPNYKKCTKQKSETSWEYLFKHRDDPNREIVVTVMAFEVPNS